MIQINAIRPKILHGRYNLPQSTEDRTSKYEGSQIKNSIYTSSFNEAFKAQAGKLRVSKKFQSDEQGNRRSKVIGDYTPLNMKVLVKNQRPESIECDALIVNVFEGTKNSTSSVDEALDGLIKKVIKEEDFKGKLGSTLVIRTGGLIKARKVIIVGFGEKDKFDLNNLRKAVACAIRCAKKENAKTVCMALDTRGKIHSKEMSQAVTEVSKLALYKFDKYKSKSEVDKKKNVHTVTIVESDKSKIKDIEAGIKMGNLVAKAQKLARDLVSEPAITGTPTFLAKVARQVAKENNLTVKVYDKEECKKMGMDAFLAVNQGSNEPPKFIVIKYTPKGKAKKHVAIIGKGITFDSGGLSLKPAQAMETMKDDKSGACAVIGTMSVIKELKPDIAVTAIIALTENMPSGRAYRPGDVVRAMDMQTIEILNTDAEGRVTLADSISYAKLKLSPKPDEIIDLATLTGACVVALGETASGIMTNNQKLADKIIKAGNQAGERMWQLPLYDEDREKIKSDIADMINTGAKGKSGAQNGAVFLEKFVGGIPWVHIDIAGPSWIDKEDAYGPKGPTGVGVRTLINYLTNYA